MPQGFEVEVHRAAADEAVAGSDIFIEVVVLELRATTLSQHLLGGEPDVALDAAPTQRAQSAAVVLHQQHCARLLGRGALSPHHGRQHAGPTIFECVDGSLDDFFHVKSVPAGPAWLYEGSLPK